MTAGLLAVCDDIVNTEHISRLLPPEHRVLAARPRAYGGINVGIHDVIVEGPMLPEWPDQNVEPVPVILVLQINELPSLRLNLEGYWSSEDGMSAHWPVRSWTFAEVMDAWPDNPVHRFMTGLE